MTDRRVEGSVEDAPSGQPASVEDTTFSGRSDVEGGAGGPGERPLRPEAAAERADGIDEITAGDGVQFFEGDLGGEATDMERGA